MRLKKTFQILKAIGLLFFWVLISAACSTAHNNKEYDFTGKGVIQSNGLLSMGEQMLSLDLSKYATAHNDLANYFDKNVVVYGNYVPNPFPGTPQTVVVEEIKSPYQYSNIILVIMVIFSSYPFTTRVLTYVLRNILAFIAKKKRRYSETLPTIQPSYLESSSLSRH